MDTISKDLLQELECPVCMLYMSPPITLCENGHNICVNCKPKLQNCPTCRSNFLTARNRTAEIVTKLVKYPCQYRLYGCKEELLLDLIQMHQEECIYKPLKCPLDKILANCDWMGLITDVKKHIEDAHNRPNIKFEVPQGIESWSACLIKFKNYVDELSNSLHVWTQVVFFLDKIFLWNSKPRDNFLYSCVLFVGPKYGAPSFKYKLTIRSKDNIECISACHISRDYETDMDEIIQNQECAIFPFQFLKKCTDEKDNALYVDMEIVPLTS